MKNWIIVGLLVLGLVGCKGDGGGGGDDEGDNKSPMESCKETCANGASCDGTPETYQSTCEESCETVVQASREAGCIDALESVYDCAGTEVDCEATEPTTRCESQVEDFFDCMVADSGGGSSGDGDQ